MYEGIVQDLIDELGRLPGIGPKSAQRIAFHILTMEETDIKRLAEILSVIKERVSYCEICGTVSESAQCRICTDPRRDATMICVVEEPKDVVAVERSREFNGRYHVLGGALNPGRDIGPSSLRISQLMQRLQDPTITEVIIATDPDSEGEATATYLARQLAQMGITVSRIATGVQMGGDLEYADEVTLGRAIAGRRTLNS
ncbi:MAG: recombination protein RecR [Actinomycetota bacterium]|jgi:recombination protein RecR